MMADVKVNVMSQISSILPLVADIKKNQDKLMNKLVDDCQSTQLESLISLNERIIKLLHKFGTSNPR